MEELQALRRLAELEDRAAGASPFPEISAGAEAKPDQRTFGQNFVGGMKAGGKDFGYGLAQRFTNAAQNGFGAAEAHLSGMEMPSDDYKQYSAQLEGDIKKNRADPSLKTGAGQVGNFVSKALPAVAATFIPGGQTLSGSAIIGAMSGLLEPTVGNESALVNTGLGLAGGTGGYGLGKGIGYLGNKFTTAAASRFNPERTATLKAAKEAGYVFPPSEINPGFFNNLIESVGGKAATRQQAAKMNQAVANKLVAGDIGIPALSKGGIEAAITRQTQPYAAVSGISPEAKAAVEGWRGANANAKAWWKSYGVDFHPDKQATAKAFAASARQLENQMDDLAVAAGRPELVPQLLQARIELGKLGTVERAFNDATGDVSQRVLARMAEKGLPLSGGMKTAAQTARAFPSVTRDAASVPSPGVSKLGVALPYLMLGGASGAAGAGGAYAHGSPYGAAYAALPLLASPAARAVMLSRAYQSMLNPSTGSAALKALGSPYGRAMITGSSPFVAHGLLAQ